MKKFGSKSKFEGKIAKSFKIQDEKTLVMLLRDYNEEGVVPFHMPGHKRSKKLDYLGGAQFIDVTETNEFDNLHDAKNTLKDAQQRAADFFGVKACRYLVGGATAGVLSAIRATTHGGDGILIARNCHRSVYNAVELCALRPYYVTPAYFEEYGFNGSVVPADIEKVLDEHKNIKLVVITSPTYEGVLSDIKSIADICHAHDALLFVDEAHGAHLGLSKRFEQSARNLGADIVVNSMHKTLPSLTQTAVLHVCSDRVDVESIDRNLAVFESSSPSYVLMASIDECIHYLSGKGAIDLENWADRVEKFRKSFERNKHYKIFNGAKEGRIFAYDDTKIIFLTVESSLSGIEFQRKLRKDYKIELEFAGSNYALALTGAGDELPAYLALSEAVFDMENKAKDRYGLVNVQGVKVPKKVYEPYEIDCVDVEFVRTENAVGRVCAESIWAYPPGIPIICKGEIIEQDFLRHALFLYECGMNVVSEYKAFPDNVLTVAVASDDAEKTEE
ncbi:MAG: aminotransferase class I/II-fold pyridoxal phosphate-dependent enzyme [Bacteroides sp.]|nr:aminotransferase class I/II-fold pyridoxal phosphate-dependent enzyme [Bacillota bacterium]MCM1393579.1 aminotransferase class I/II-fold pyridoxal phosphate-dependent enzyme [[Eubacterium] siraeum]MCM1455002.1 aminotransferase class I/II-fold pyridoxal phosphate-dependent enzyme [Bacteroides sp.]